MMGGEGNGLHDLVKKNCDLLVRIPMAGKSRRSTFLSRPGSCCSLAIPARPKC